MGGLQTGGLQTGGGAYVDDERAQLVLLQGDDLVVARLLGQLQQGARRSQPQPGHVGFAGGREEVTLGPVPGGGGAGGLGADLLLPCSVRSPSLCRMAVSILSVELPDLLWLFLTPSSHLTISLMPWI